MLIIAIRTGLAFCVNPRAKCKEQGNSQYITNYNCHGVVVSNCPATLWLDSRSYMQVASGTIGNVVKSIDLAFSVI